MGEVIAAAGIGAAWVILCVSAAAGLYVGERLLIMLRVRCDWADAGLRMQVKAHRKHPRHRAPRKPPLARVPAGAIIRRADHVLHPDHTEVITPVESQLDQPAVSGTGVLSAETVTVERVIIEREPETMTLRPGELAELRERYPADGDD